MQENINKKISNYEMIYSEIEEFKGLLNKTTVEEIKEFSREIRAKVEDSIKTDRLLRIGIVGEVKAGKSTFLNALVFNGNQILPQAATPMTAALTKIVYSEKLRAEVEFYNKADWETINEFANEYIREYDVLKKEYIEEKKFLRKFI